jgi:hypothetical protein
MLVVRLGGLSLLAFLPLLAAGVVLYGRVGISSQSDGATALARVAAAGVIFPVMNALFHLGALLLLPGGVALAIALRQPDADPWLLLGGLFLVVAVATGAGLVFALNQGLWGMSVSAAVATADARAAAVAADMNLRTQAGAELVQSLGLGLWLLATAVAMSSSGWDGWIVWLGVAGGVGFILAGLSSVLMSLAVVGPALGVLGALGLALFAAWDLVVGWRLVTG